MTSVTNKRIYGVYPPNEAERAEIFAIHLGLRGRHAAAFDLDALADASDGYTGADIKEVVQLALKLAFHAKEDLANAHLQSALAEVRPLSKTDPESVAAMTNWLDTHTKPAGIRPPGTTASSRKRSVSV